MTGGYDLLFAVRLDENYLPTGAIEVPREAVEELYPPGTRVTWTKKLERHRRTRKVPASQLLPDGG